MFAEAAPAAIDTPELLYRRGEGAVALVPQSKRRQHESKGWHGAPALLVAIRSSEAAALLALLYGLAASKWLLAAGSAAVIMASYALHRRRFPVVEQRDNGSMGMSDGGD